WPRRRGIAWPNGFWIDGRFHGKRDEHKVDPASTKLPIKVNNDVKPIGTGFALRRVLRASLSDNPSLEKSRPGGHLNFSAEEQKTVVAHDDLIVALAEPTQQACL